MDVYGLKNHIISNPDYIGLILEKAGFHYIDDEFNNGKEVRCAREEGRNPTSVRVLKDTLSSTCFSTNVKGDLITLVQSKLDLNFPQTIKKISEIVDYKVNTNNEITLPFGGFFKNIARLRNEEEFDIDTYEEEILNSYEQMPSLLFYEDGILPNIQQQFDIGYDSVSGRIVVPWRTFDGKIAGIMGRLNKKKLDDDEIKWYPIIPFPKSKTLYGFVQNYSSMQEKRLVLIGESEKHSLQVASKGLNVGVSLGGSFMSDIQANHIKSLFPERVIVMLDEGLEEEHSRSIAEQLKMDKYYKNKVGYVFDKQNFYLPKGSKMAPADLDKKSLNKLIKECTIYV